MRKDPAGNYLQTLPLKISTAIERRRAGELFRKAIEAAPSGMVLVNDEHSISFANRMAETLFHNTAEEMVGMPFRHLCLFEGVASAEQSDDWVEELVERGGEGGLVETIGMRVDGHQFPMEVGANEIQIHGETFYLFSLKDITHRRQRESERLRYIKRLEEVNAELEDRNRELDDFASIISHDLSSPLATVKMTLELVRKKIKTNGADEDHVLERCLDSAKEAIGCIANLVHKVLDFSEKGRRAIQLEDIDLTDCVETALGSLDSMIQRTGAIVRVGELPVLPCDRVLVGQVFQNLIQNSLKFHKPGVQLEIDVFSEDRKGQDIMVVKDNGLGHESKNSSQMFQPFQYFHSHDHHEGRGLGLGICKRIVEKHGGRDLGRTKPRRRNLRQVHPIRTPLYS